MCDLRLPHPQDELRHSSKRDSRLNMNKTRAAVCLETID
jgi:hypothetical protein